MGLKKELSEGSASEEAQRDIKGEAEPVCVTYSDLISTLNFAT